MTFHYKYFEDIPGWKEKSSHEIQEIHNFLKEKCKHWTEDAIMGLALFMKNEKIFDPRIAFNMIKEDLDKQIKPNFDL